jgi:RNA polymerase sigma-54 factor
MEFDFDQLQEQRQRNLPRLIEANYLLNLSTQELEQIIAAEMVANPALEADDLATCPLCGAPLEGGFCITCMVDQETPLAPAPDGDEEWDRFETVAQLQTADEDFDELTLIGDGAGIIDELKSDIRTVLSGDNLDLAIWLIEALDERGFLDIPMPEVARLTGRSIDDIEQALSTIQEIAPAGVGARNLRESLLLQIDFLRQAGIEVPELVEAIVSDHLTELGNHRYQQIARQLRISPEEIGPAHDFIQAYLSPHPLQSDQSRTWQSPAQTPYVTPDVLIAIVDDELLIEVTGSSRGQLRINGLYDELAATFRKRGKPDTNELSESTSEEEKDHIRDSVARAKQFIGKIHQRRETLLRISTCICELQEDFLREGVRELQPLTRSQVAQQIGVHESTVSRATANKYVMLPSKKVIPFSDFFSPSLSVKDVIKELIEAESRTGNTLSDMRIRELLLQRGYRIARRTVAKYRAELNILPSTVRS